MWQERIKAGRPNSYGLCCGACCSSCSYQNSSSYEWTEHAAAAEAVGVAATAALELPIERRRRAT